ncbi:MAG: DUF6476 family protein [Pseudomonadota bacterium]
MVKVTHVSDMEPPEPTNLRFLRILVTVLTAVMIAGLITVVVLLVTRLPDTAIRVPDALILPEGETPRAITQGPGWWAVVTENGRILIYDAQGALRDEVEVTLE